jgi:hypothetical protein
MIRRAPRIAAAFSGGGVPLADAEWAASLHEDVKIVTEFAT